VVAGRLKRRVSDPRQPSRRTCPMREASRAFQKRQAPFRPWGTTEMDSWRRCRPAFCAGWVSAMYGCAPSCRHGRSRPHSFYPGVCGPLPDDRIEASPCTGGPCMASTPLAQRPGVAAQ
jgi:hypothetical protein